MPSDSSPMRGFKPVFTVIGVLYVLLASSMLGRGVGVMRDFAVPDAVVASPVFADFFSFFYQLMAAVGVLTVLFGWTVRDRGAQLWVARVFCALGVLITMRDLSTSDSSFGNHLYRGPTTLIPVVLDALFTVAFGVFTFRRRRPG